MICSPTGNLRRAAPLARLKASAARRVNRRARAESALRKKAADERIALKLSQFLHKAVRRPDRGSSQARLALLISATEATPVKVIATRISLAKRSSRFS